LREQLSHSTQSVQSHRFLVASADGLNLRHLRCTSCVKGVERAADQQIK
jgi:hypothetical protein